MLKYLWGVYDSMTRESAQWIGRSEQSEKDNSALYIDDMLSTIGESIRSYPRPHRCGNIMRITARFSTTVNMQEKFKPADKPIDRITRYPIDMQYTKLLNLQFNDWSNKNKYNINKKKVNVYTDSKSNIIYIVVSFELIY